MSKVSDPRFELRKVTATEWLILDHRFEANDPRQTVGCVYRVDDFEVEVMWLRDMPVANRYMTAFEALDDVRRVHEHKRTSTRSSAVRPLLAI